MSWENVLKKQFDFDMLNFKEKPNGHLQAKYGEEPNDYSILLMVGYWRGDNLAEIMNPKGDIIFREVYRGNKITDEVIRGIEEAINKEMQGRLQ